MSDPVLSPPSPEQGDPAVPSEPSFCTKHLRADIGRRTVRGAASISVGQGSQFFINVATTGVLARLLSPEDFGLVAMTTVVTSFLLIFKDAGLTSATIQREHLTHAQVSTLFWINAAAGIAIALAMVIAAPLVAAGFGDPRLEEITRAMAVSFVFGGLTVQHQALIRRQMRFKSLAARGVVASVIGSATGVTLGVLGFGYWSLVGMAVANSIASMITVWLAVPWMPDRPRWAPGTRSLLKFGSDILVCDIATFLSRKVDAMLIGWYWGPLALGLYDKAYTLLLAPVKQINRPLASVFVPTLSRLANERETCRRYFLHALETLASIVVPLLLGITLFADELVLLWLGPKWEECAVLFRLMSVAALLGGMSTPLGWLQVSAGQTRRYRQLGIVTSAILVAGFAAGLSWGPRGVATSYSITVLLLAVPTWHFGLKGSPVRLQDVFRAIGVPLASALPATAAGWGMMALLGSTAPHWQVVTAGLLTFAAVYGALLLGVFGRAGRFIDLVRSYRNPARRPGLAPETTPAR